MARRPSPPSFPTATLGLLAAFATALPAEAVHACGGFFCDSTAPTLPTPIAQTAERVIFSVAADGTVTATIEIQYVGDAASFAWVLPVAGTPEVRVSSYLALQRLQAATEPSYVLTTRGEGWCSDGRYVPPPPPSPPSDGTACCGLFAAEPPEPPDAGVVRVEDQGTVGPYDFVVISVDRAAPAITDAAVTWLEDNGYTIDPAGASLLRPYLEAGMNLLAFRLTSGNPVGWIRPVEITFGAGMPSIPIRPTAVAAALDMGVMVWVLGSSRAFPSNYFSLELNDALVNWLDPGASYGDLVTTAANEAGGQGFVTEMAGVAAPLADAILSDAELADWDSLRDAYWDGDELGLLVLAVERFGTWDGMREVFAATVPISYGLSLADFQECPRCRGFGPIAGLDAAAFLAAMEASVIEPMQRTRALFSDHAYVTRFYTTMSAAEMTRDPMFDFSSTSSTSSTLGDVAPVHTAERVIECSPSVALAEAPWRALLPSGEIVRGTGTAWPFSPGDEGMPANARVSRLERDGPGEVIIDNQGTIHDALAARSGAAPGSARTVVPAGGGACSAATPRRGPSVVVVVVLFAALGAGRLSHELALRRRRCTSGTGK